MVGIDKDLESFVRSCKDCAAVKQVPAKAPLYPLTWPNRPWERIHIDFAGPFLFFLSLWMPTRSGQMSSKCHRLRPVGRGGARGCMCTPLLI